MPNVVPGLRSPYEQVGGLYAFGRMLDKIRLAATNQLPADYHSFLGAKNPRTLDGRCCRFLHIDYAALAALVKEGRSDEELITWAFANGRRPADEEIEIWNAFLRKRGWRDEASPYLREVIVKEGFAPEAALTFFDFMDIDEGRPLRYPADVPAPSQPAVATAIIPGLRSPYDMVHGLVYFGRMLDKIRLHRDGKLPEGWAKMNGAAQGYDGICCRFLRIDYPALVAETLRGGSDEGLLEWAFTHGRKPTEEDLLVWNGYMSKRSWRDEHTSRLHFRLEESGMPVGAALTMFDYMDLDEGRPLRFPR